MRASKCLKRNTRPTQAALSRVTLAIRYEQFTDAAVRTSDFCHYRFAFLIFDSCSEEKFGRRCSHERAPTYLHSFSLLRLIVFVLIPTIALVVEIRYGQIGVAEIERSRHQSRSQTRT
jgi:hypothetical protein